ncbi:MAG: hypothetical protein KBE65_21980 [Phycisphaerae bacterium]|nr:hypothetical protein [Phycisphaerae bacterium]
MRPDRYPAGWNEERVRHVIDHYDQQNEEEAVAEDEAAYENRDLAIMEIPKELVPTVREMIARYEEAKKASA